MGTVGESYAIEAARRMELPAPVLSRAGTIYVCMYVCIVECNIMRECTARCAFGRRVSPPDCHATATGGGNRASPRAANASAG